MTLDPTSRQNSTGGPAAPPRPPGTRPPGRLQVIKRTGQLAEYDTSKIFNAIFQAYVSAQGSEMKFSDALNDSVRTLTGKVDARLRNRMPDGGSIHIEDIQDQVEVQLMRSGEHKVARSYVLYREERAQERKKSEPQEAAAQAWPKLHIKQPNGSLVPLDKARLQQSVDEATRGIAEVDAELILQDALRALHDGIEQSKADQALALAARALLEREPNYSMVAARFLLRNIYDEVLDALNIPSPADIHNAGDVYRAALPLYIAKGVKLGYLNSALADFDLEKIAATLMPERDLQFAYLGLQTLYDRYLLHENKVRYELPQIFFMRVAMGLALQEDNKEEQAIEYYRLLSSFDYMTSTPTLFNSGTAHSQLSSCFLTTVQDDLHSIFSAIGDNAMLSKWAGGLGNDWTPVRALGSHIKGTNGESQGIVPFLKIVNDTAVAVNQGGKRKGAVCCYLETWHLDIEEFLELRKNTGDDRRRTQDMHTANWIPDLFMKRLHEDGDWTLFSPSSAPDLHDLTGEAFEARYREYEQMADQGQIQPSRRIKAMDLWRKMLNMVFETGHPWMTFKDACNLRSPQQHCGRIHSSNLCTEITLNTSEDEIAVCNLGSVNLGNHIADGKLDNDRLRQTVRLAVRMLDNVIDINYYAVEAARGSNMKHRPVGLGLMGFQDALYQMGIPYGSPEAVEFADTSMEQMAYYAIEASSDLAAERGSYESYDGSLWSQGILPLDSLQILRQQRGEQFMQMDDSSQLDWDVLRQKIAAQGMRNSNVMAIAPTATISNIVGVTQSIEPTYQNLYVKSNLSGEFTVINRHLVEQLKKEGLWDQAMIADLKHYDGSVQQIDRIPDHIKAQYATAFEIHPRWLVESAARRQKWIDQAQSLNLYMANPDGRALDLIYRMCWLQGLKTTYYLRALGATTVEKVSSAVGSGNAVSPTAHLEAAPQPLAQPAATPQTQPAPVPNACSLDDPDCEACQ